MKMNLPNRLSILRVILVPFFVFFMLVPSGIIPYGIAKWIALVIFVAACATDFADGQISRRCNMITDFGKFVDSLADKMLTCSAFICLIVVRPDAMPVWIVIIIICREFVISGLRMIASDNGRVIAAGIWGKFKTGFQMAAIILLIANFGGMVWFVLETICVYVALVLAVISMVDYLVRNFDILKEGSTK